MIWLDAHLSPRVAEWINEKLGHESRALRDLGLRHAEDEEIFDKAHKAGAVILTKDKDFVEMVARLGPPPSIIWLRCGNTSEERLKQILTENLEQSLAFIESGESIVEIR